MTPAIPPIAAAAPGILVILAANAALLLVEPVAAVAALPPCVLPELATADALAAGTLALVSKVDDGEALVMLMLLLLLVLLLVLLLLTMLYSAVWPSKTIPLLTALTCSLPTRAPGPPGVRV